MKTKDNKPQPTPAENQQRMTLTRRNYQMMLIGAGIIFLGFVLMIGGGSQDPDQFNYAMFSFRRITLAPILILGGFGFEAYAIMHKFKRQ